MFHAPIELKHAVNGELECYSNPKDRCNFESHKLNTSFESYVDCCLGNGYWYKVNGSDDCVQCIGKQLNMTCIASLSNCR